MSKLKGKESIPSLEMMEIFAKALLKSKKYQ